MECSAPHCNRHFQAHFECCRHKSPILCRTHLRRYDKWPFRLVIGIVCGVLLVGGSFGVGYSSSVCANALYAYFSYDTSLLPHRLQVLVHGLAWLTLAGFLAVLFEKKSVKAKPERRQMPRKMPKTILQRRPLFIKTTCCP